MNAELAAIRNQLDDALERLDRLETGGFPVLLDVDQAAELLGVHRQTVYEMLREDRLPGRKIGRAWRIHRDSLLDWIADRE